ncbi:MAG: hypothetical protein JNM69_12840 [Archangium sp.]|nr:hypothetical protein [Archangium sp.]
MARAWLTVMLVASGCCCRPEKSGRVDGAPVTSTDGMWTATPSVVFSKGHTGVHSSVSDQVFHELVLRRGDETQKVLIDRLSAGYLESSASEFAAAKHATLSVEFHGHVVSVTADDGKRWRHVVLDSGAPFVCGASTKPAAPPTRDLVLADLRAAGFGTPRTCDIEGATRVLCAHANDDELWSVAIAQMLKHSLVDSEREPLDACLDPRRPALRDQLLAALRDRDAERVGLAAESLAKSNDVIVQNALAEVLTRGAPTERAGCWSTAKVTWALAAVTTTLGTAESSTRKALLDVARAPAACPDELTGKAARVYAVAALGVVKDEALRELSATCTTEHAPWKLTFTKWNEAMYANLTDAPLECLAKQFIR